MNTKCPHCLNEIILSVRPETHRKFGRYRRKSDGQYVRRFRCRKCAKWFSNATFHPCYGQKKRHLNDKIYKRYCSGVSLRRIAKIFGISRTTVARKIDFMGIQCGFKNRALNERQPLAQVVEFDDLETFEHSRMKPLSVTLAVEHKTRRILGFKVSQMPCKGHLTKQSLRKYGFRKDERTKGRVELFKELKGIVSGHAHFKSDENPHYPNDLKREFPSSTHERFKGQRGSTTGQGELKKVRFDPLFSLNHTCAMLRANINRLFRKTWCTTKLRSKLERHLAMYAYYHNSQLIKLPTPAG